MKKILFVFSLFLALGLNVQAQSSKCAKSCAAKSGSAASGCHASASVAHLAVPSEYQMAAAKMASLDASIEPRTDATTGEIKYVRKESCHSGSVSYVNLNFDPSTSTFVNVGPSQMAATPAATNSTGCGAAKAAGGKSCCAGKAKTATASNTAPASTEAKPVKTGGSN